MTKRPIESIVESERRADKVKINDDKDDENKQQDEKSIYETSVDGKVSHQR